MKPIITTFAGIILATAVALAGSAATAGNTGSHTKKGGIVQTYKPAIPQFGSRIRDRAWGERHEGHFGHPFHGTFGGKGSYTKADYDRINAKGRRARGH